MGLLGDRISLKMVHYHVRLGSGQANIAIQIVAVTARAVTIELSGIFRRRGRPTLGGFSW